MSSVSSDDPLFQAIPKSDQTSSSNQDVPLRLFKLMNACIVITFLLLMLCIMAWTGGARHVGIFALFYTPLIVASLFLRPLCSQLQISFGCAFCCIGFFLTELSIFDEFATPFRQPGPILLLVMCLEAWKLKAVRPSDDHQNIF
jgi:hypothetical protein